MAKKQTRRSVSLSRDMHDSATREAARRGVSLSKLVEHALASVGVALRPQRLDPDQRRSSRERQVLGDEVADACGFE